MRRMIRRIRRRRRRRRRRPGPWNAPRYRRRRRREWGIGWALAVGAVVVTIGTTVLLERHRRMSTATELAEHAREVRMDPVDLALRAARSHRVIFLGDVPTSTEPKRLAADVVEALAQGPGLDAVALAVASDLQPQIDEYLASEDGDIGVLLMQPASVGSDRGATRGHLPILRRVWRLNRELPAGRRIRVIAADLPGWPPDPTLPPPTIARRYATRDAHMQDVLDKELLRGNPNARLLVFMGGYHGLKRGGARLRFTGGNPITVIWLAARLRQDHSLGVYTILTDGSRQRSGVRTLESYGPTRVFDIFRERFDPADSPFALVIDERFDQLADPIMESSVPGIELDLLPDGYRLRDVADAYIFLGTRPRLQWGAIN